MRICDLKSTVSNFGANFVGMVFSKFGKILEAHHQQIIKTFSHLLMVYGILALVRYETDLYILPSRRSSIQVS